MPKYNSLTSAGKLVNNPTWLFTKITLENPEATIPFEYGIICDLLPDHLGYLLMRRGVTLGEMDSYIEKRKPKITATYVKTCKEYIFVHKGGGWAIPLLKK